MVDQKLQESILDNAAQIQERRKALHEAREALERIKEGGKNEGA